MTVSPSTGFPQPAWAVDLAVGTAITIPSGARLDRDAFFGWLWDQNR